MKRFLLCAAIVAAASLSLRGPAEGTAAVLAAPIMLEDCLFCDDDPPYCSPDDHDAWDGPYEPNKRGGGAHPIGDACWLGSCHEKHRLGCEDSFAFAKNAEQLRLALVAEDRQKLKVAIATLGENGVRINVERSALQLLDCEGSTVAHFPVSDDVIGTLTN